MYTKALEELLFSIQKSKHLNMPDSVSNLGILRLGEHIEIRRELPTSSTTSFFLLLSSGGLIVYLLYKSLNDENQSGVQQQPQQPSSRPVATGQRWSAQNWLRWLIFGDTSDLRGQYFGPIQPGTLSTTTTTEASTSTPGGYFWFT